MAEQQREQHHSGSSSSSSNTGSSSGGAPAAGGGRQQRSVTISDVARAAGVSKATASVALSAGRGRSSVRVAPETRRRIREAADRLGYERSALAVALSVGRTNTVGLVSQVDAFVESTTEINAYQKDVMVAVTCACARAGLRLTTILVRSNGNVSAAEITDGRVDGAVLASLRDETLARDLFARGFPAVTIGSGYSERRVGPDNRGGMEEAVAHLFDHGHRNIVYVGYALSNVDTWTTQERAHGYRDAMLSRGLSPLLLTNDELNDAFDAASATRKKQITACVCFNDSVALHVLRWARHRGLKVPRDFSVVGFDNGVLSSCADPRLTSVENPLDTQAEIAISLLNTLWGGEPALSPAPIATHLIVRASTGPVTGGGERGAAAAAAS